MPLRSGWDDNVVEHDASGETNRAGPDGPGLRVYIP